MPETWYAVFLKNSTPHDSDPYSLSTVLDHGALRESGCTWLQLDGDPRGKVWDRQTQRYVDAVATPPTRIARDAFLRRFSAQQYFDWVRADDNAEAVHFLAQIQHSADGMVDLADPAVHAGLDKLANAGIVSLDDAHRIRTP